MIDRGDIRQAGLTATATSGLHCRALSAIPFEHKAGQPDCKFKEAGGTVREIDV